MSKKSVVFVVAHPDDVAFTFGGTAWILKDKYYLHVVCASKGERGYDCGWKGKGLQPPRAKTAKIREEEERQSCKLLGANLTFLGEIDGEIGPSKKSCDKVAKLFSRLKPTAVFTHSPFDKKDHSAVFSIAYLAIHQASLFWTTDFYADEAYDLRRISVFMNIDDSIEGKKKLIACHRSHMKGTVEEEVEKVIARNRLLGRMNLCEYAEGFVTPLPIANKRWGRSAEQGRTLLID
jgi:LmbE family N-acetylglucosaminyl deacetylase